MRRRRWVTALALVACAATGWLCTPAALAGGVRPFVESLTGLGPVGFHPGSFAGDGGPARDALVDSPTTVAVDQQRGVLFTDSFNNRILRVKHGRASVLPGTGHTRLRWPVIARSRAGVLVVDGGAHRVLLVRGGRVRVLAGTGRRGYEPGPQKADHTPLNAPTDAIRYRGGWLVSDSGNCRLRFIDRRGRIRLFAGGGISLRRCWRSYNDQGRWRDWAGPLRDVGDGQLARRARILVPGFMATDGTNVWVTDFLDHRVRQIEGQSGRITTVLGTGRPALHPAVRGPALSFDLYWPSGVALETRGTLLVTDSGAHRVMRLFVAAPS